MNELTNQATNERTVMDGWIETIDVIYLPLQKISVLKQIAL